jgi:hypothetical protein
MLQDLALLLVNFIAESIRGIYIPPLPARRLSPRERKQLQEQAHHG